MSSVYPFSIPPFICKRQTHISISQAKFLFANSTVMEAHYRAQHGQEIRVHAYPLYYEINYR